MLNARLAGLTDYPFARLTALLGPADAKPQALNLAVGEPQHAPPPLLAETLARHAADWGRYPPIAGTPAFRAAAAGWLARRYGLKPGTVDPDRAILPVQGTREALFQIATVAAADRADQHTAVLVPNPSYATYAAAGRLAGAAVVPLSTRRETGFLPDLGAVPAEVLERTALAYLCSPSNPEGAVAGLDTLTRALALARQHDFVLAVDECYAEVYDHAAPPGALQAAEALGADAAGDPLGGLVVFHSLSKRSSAAGLRSGFVAGDRTVLALLQRLRTYASSAPPLPVLAASAALWSDEAHVADNRALDRAKLDRAEAAFGRRSRFYRPDGGFFLRLEVGDGELAARRLWEAAAIRVLPGAYLGREDADGFNPGHRFIRLALVHDLAVLGPALERAAAILSTLETN